jgi:hypothetical protein
MSFFSALIPRVFDHGTLKSCVTPGVHAVLKTGSWVRYCIFDLATGKAEQENNFPTSNLAFLGQSERNVGIFTAGQVRRALWC